MLNETLSCSADANVQPSAVGCGKNTHDLRAKLNHAWPAARRGGFEGDSEDLTLCIFAITAKAHASCGKIKDMVSSNPGTCSGRTRMGTASKRRGLPRRSHSCAPGAGSGV